jgi:hypothetical protein
MGVAASNPPAAGGLLELLTWRERVAACRPGDGPGTAPSGAFPRRRTVDSELVRTRALAMNLRQKLNAKI